MSPWLEKPRSYWDLSGKRVFAIIGMMRSGSNFLERTLDGLPEVMCHGELFNHQFIGFQHQRADSYAGYDKGGVKKRDDDLSSFVRNVLKSSEKPVVGFRIFGEHHTNALAKTLFDARIAKIILTRNYLEAFVSLCIARQTDQWIVLHPGTQKNVDQLNLDADQFKDFVIQNLSFYRETFETLAQTDQQCMIVDYSELNAAPTINQITTYIGASSRIDMIKEVTVRQNPAPIYRKIGNYDEILRLMQKGEFCRYILKIK